MVNLDEKRVRAYQALGDRCQCPGCPVPTKSYAYFHLDYIDAEDGKEHRKELKGKNIVNWILENRNEAPFRIQILCANCHNAKTKYGGGCPHLMEYPPSMEDYHPRTKQAQAAKKLAQYVAARNIKYFGNRHAQEQPWKLCKTCGRIATGIEHMIDMFGIDLNRIDGVRFYCKACRSKKGGVERSADYFSYMPIDGVQVGDITDEKMQEVPEEQYVRQVCEITFLHGREGSLLQGMPQNSSPSEESTPCETADCGQA